MSPAEAAELGEAAERATGGVWLGHNEDMTSDTEGRVFFLRNERVCGAVARAAAGCTSAGLSTLERWGVLLRPTTARCSVRHGGGAAGELAPSSGRAGAKQQGSLHRAAGEPPWTVSVHAPFGPSSHALPSSLPQAQGVKHCRTLSSRPQRHSARPGPVPEPAGAAWRAPSRPPPAARFHTGGAHPPARPLQPGFTWVAFVYAGELPTTGFGANSAGVAFTLNAV